MCCIQWNRMIENELNLLIERRHIEKGGDNKGGLFRRGENMLTGFMPRKPRFVSGVKRHVSEKNN